MSDIKEYQKQFMQVEVIEPIASVWTPCDRVVPEIEFSDDLSIDDLMELVNENKWTIE